MGSSRLISAWPVDAVDHENFDWALSPTSKVTQKLTGIWKTSDVADALYHFDAGLATKVATRAELSLAYVYDYKNRTIVGVKKDDLAPSMS